MDFEVSENMEFQRRSWIVERVGWVAIAAVLFAAALGLFGRGALDSSVASADDGSISVEYNRFWRVQSPTDLRVSVSGTVNDTMRVRLWLSRDYVDAIGVVRTTPEAASVEAGRDRITYEFALAAANQPVVLVFRIEPQRAWRVQGRVGVEGGGEARFRQFIYP